MRVLRWWRARSQADRFELYISATLYANLLFVPLATAGAAGTAPVGGRWVPVTATAAGHVALCALLMRAGIGTYPARAPVPARLVAAGAAVTALLVGMAHAVLPSAEPDGPAATVALTAVAVYAIALTTVVRPVIVLGTAGVAGCAAVAVAAGSRTPALVLAVVVVVLVPACRLTLWTLGMVRELDRARQAQAVLAVAEERLRFARDLHDVVGRTLSVVALKAELSARLARRGRAEAAGEMEEVRRIAHESLAELRAVVGGYRSADLATELAGARALLGSAGIVCRVDGDGHGLPAPVQTALGWVVREGTTNVLRHSEARACTITVRFGPGTATLVMDNDGTPAATGPPRLGNGLVGLAERITVLGGRVTAAPTGPDGFRLAADVPVDA